MSVKYIGLDVHQATTVAAVVDGRGKLVMESIVETKASMLLEFLHGLRGELHLTLEEGTWAAWLRDVLQPHVQQLIICDPRKNKYLQQGSQNDKIESRKLAQLLRAGLLSPVYHGESGLRTLRELTRSYLTLTQDLTRVMNRIKAVYRGRGIPCASQKVYNPHHRDEWLKKLREPGLRRRAERLYQQLDQLQPLRQQARREMLQESRRHAANRWLQEIPYVGSIRAAQLIALVQTPHRFRTKRQLWAYSGLAVRVQSSADYRFAHGQLQRTRNADTVRGLINQIRGFLLERGICFRKGPANLRSRMPALLENAEQNLTSRMRRLLDHVWQEWKQLETDVAHISEPTRHNVGFCLRRASFGAAHCRVGHDPRIENCRR